MAHGSQGRDDSVDHPKVRARRTKSGNCQLCQIWRYSLHRDHCLPLFKGGSDDETNIQYLCANCHEDKSREERRGYCSLSPEIIKRIADQNRGRPVSVETRAKISAAHTGRFRIPTEERRRKPITKGASRGKGRTLSAEHKQRIGEGAKKSWERWRRSQSPPVL